MQDRKPSTPVSAAFYIIGMATLAAIIIGVGAWLITQFVIGAPQSQAINAAAIAAIVVLVIGVIMAFVRSSRNQ